MTQPLDTTWDGLPIAPDDPRGATIVVRRRAGDDFEYLLLHRAIKGPDFAGAWAWTPPAGARQPGEAVVPAALRELEEEAGITGATLHPVDLSDGWSQFMAEVPADTAIVLHDVEHDAHQWVSAQRAGRLCRPIVVARQIPIVDTIPAASITFAAPTGDEDVDAWRAHRGLPGSGPLDAGDHVLLVDGVPAGFAAHRRTGDVVDFECAIGDPEWSWRGLGPVAIWAYVRQVLLVAHPDAAWFTARPGEDTSARRALAKAGFARDGEVFALSRAHWLG